MSIGFAELVVDELLKFVNAVVRTGVCPECEGEGEHDPDGASVLCSRCDGTGKSADPVAGISVAELEYDRGAMVVRARALFANYRRQRSTTGNSYNFFVRDTTARFAEPVVGQGVDPWGKPKLETVWPDQDDAMKRAIEVADKLAKEGFFE